MLLHLDGDSFFAACEITKYPALRGTPVATGAERGMLTSLTYEAKAFGVKRGMSAREARALCPTITILPSDYRLYSQYSLRMAAIVARWANSVEHYSVDECFADVTGLDGLHGSYKSLAAKIKNQVQRELGFTFSFGVAETKTLAKVASKHFKPDGLAVIDTANREEFLRATPVDKVWGLGPASSRRLQELEIKTAWEFASCDLAWVKRYFTKPQQQTWHELNGRLMLPIVAEADAQQSMTGSLTFKPVKGRREFLLAELSRHLEDVCGKARRQGLTAGKLSFWLKTQSFRYYSAECRLSESSNLPTELMAHIEDKFSKLYSAHTLYRTTGVTLANLQPIRPQQGQIFSYNRLAKLERVFASVDILASRYGSKTVRLVASMGVIAEEELEDADGLDMPIWGEVS
ncbi:MAG: DNA polymerase IV [Candidatus Falkowbacteria bacterium]